MIKNTGKYAKGDALRENSEDGIWMDYENHCWYFMIKDKIWQKEEIRRTEHSEISIAFIQKGIVDAFLLTIYDCLEPSDIPFSIIDGDQNLIASLHDKEGYAWQIVLINEDNHVAAVRDGQFTDADADMLKKALSTRVHENIDDEMLDHAVEKMEQRYEPYELEQFALFTEVHEK